MNEKEKIALFDAYCADELSAQDKADFQALLESNHDLKAEFEAYLDFSKEIEKAEGYREVKIKLSAIHEEAGFVKKKKPLLLRPKFIATVSIAATIVLLITIIGPTNYDQGDNAANENVYQELNNGESSQTAEDEDSEEMADIDSSTIELDKDTSALKSPLDERLPLIKKVPKGSCFLISKNGYFITSKHLVHKRRFVRLQQKDRKLSFNAEVVYRDSILDFAVLKCAEKFSGDFQSVPFKFYRSDADLGDDVFTLGYPKSDIVYTTGVVSSETGFRSDSMTYEISMPSNPGNSGAPLFTKKGDLVGMVIANNSKKQSVTYILKPNYIQERLKNLQALHPIDMRSNYTKRYSQKSDMIRKYRPYIFEIH